MYAGSLLINPTVSEINAASLPIITFLTVVESVVNNSLFSSFCSPVNLLNNVVFPADVYPANEIVLKPRRFRDCLCNSRCFPDFANFDLMLIILLLISL